VRGLVAKQVDVLVAETLERFREKETIDVDNGNLAGIAKQKDPSRLLSDTSILATVGGIRVRTNEFADFLINYGGGEADKAPALFGTYSKYLILNKVMDKERYALPRKQANIMVFREKKLIYEHYVAREKAKVKYKDKDIKEFFGKRKADYAQKEAIDFYLIFTRSDEIAKTVLTSLREGKRSFEGLAQEFSEDGSGKKGGRVDFTEKEKVKPALWDELVRLKDGETGEQIKEGDGYYVLRRNSYRPRKDANLSSMKDRVRADFVNERYGALYKDYLVELRKLYSVERNDKVVEGAINAEEAQDKPGKEKEG